MLDLKSSALLSAFVLASGGCSIIYDGGVFGEADATVVIDPTDLRLDSIEPTSVLEGLGASESARAIPIVVHGTNISADARFAITGGGLDLDVAAETSADGTMAATSLRVAVDTELGSGDSLPISITLQQAGVEETLMLQVQGLDELAGLSGEVDTATLAPRYSRIEIGESIELVGSAPARFVATEDITISSEINADGRTDGQSSAGGFLGGAAAQDGGGGASAGGSGSNTAGGGGAGNLAMGMPGQGTGAGAGGDSTESEFLVPLNKAVGYGGGGGGGMQLGSQPGGAGGGAIELRAGGRLTLSSGALVSANGAAGSPTGLCATSGGAGGGGSGGAILLRSATELVFEVDAGSLLVNGANGGTAGGSCSGGAGSPGRVRVDAPSIVGTLSPTVRGPSFQLDSIPPIVTSASLAIALSGGIGATYFLKVNSAAPEMVTLSDTSEEVTLTLSPGLNQVCALVQADGNQGQPESLNCVSIAYLPSS